MGSVGEDEEIVLNANKRLNEGENEDRDSKSKRLRVSEPVHQDQDFGVSVEFGSGMKGLIKNGVSSSGGQTELNVNVVPCNAGLNCSDGKTRDFDLNIGFQDLESDEFVASVTERKVETINIPSDESEDDDVKIVGEKNVNARIEQIDNENSDKFRKNVDLILRLLETGFDINSSAEGERRYTREEKGKAKASDSWLSLSINGEHSPISRDLAFGIEQEPKIEELDAQVVEVEDDDDDLEFDSQPEEDYDAPNQQDEGQAMGMDNWWRRATEWRAYERRQTARSFARSEGYSEAPTNKEKSSSEDDEILGKSSGPFSTALKMVRERSTRSHERLIKWEPSNKGYNGSRDLVPSLLDLSLKALSKNAEAMVSLELVPDFLRQRLTDLFCNLRKMDVLTLELLLKGSPTEIRIKDSSWLTEKQFLKTFGNFNTKELMVLQLDLCGQCNLDYLMSKTFAQFSNCLPKLGIISLKGACRLSDNGLKPLLTSAPRLQSINLSQSSLLTHDSINILANSLGSILKELYIHECPKIDAKLALPALMKFEHLEVLSIAGIQTVSDLFVHELMAACGQRLKELDVANCQSLTNFSLKVIGELSTKLHSLNISNVEKLTDLGLLFLADGCRCIETLKFSRNNFSDEAIAAFLEASGESLKDLSLNNVTLVGPCTALSLAKCSRKLLSLDLSWCRKITNEALGLIVDSCLSLKLVKLFGCTQITDIFLNGHSNSKVKIIGLNLSPILESTDMLKSHGILLRYSPLASIYLNHVEMIY